MEPGSGPVWTAELDGFEENVVAHPPGEWAYYRVEVPDDESLLGWEIRLKEWQGNDPRQRPTVAVRRGYPPTVTSNDGWGFGTHVGPGISAGWSDEATAAKNEGGWTGLPNAADGSQEDEAYRYTFSMGQPLQPGTYYIGFFAEEDAIEPLNYRWTSRAVGKTGSGFSYEVRELDFDGGSAGGVLGPREVAYYKVEIPDHTYNSWEIELALPYEEEGEDAQLYVRKDYLPNTESASVPDADLRFPRYPGRSQVRLRKDGSEHFVTWQGTMSTPYLAGGTYYLMVVGEGRDPDRGSGRIGTGNITYELISRGETMVREIEMGLVDETSVEGAYQAGQVNYYRVRIPEDAIALKVFLEDKEGNPRLNLSRGEIPPDLGGPGHWYGHFSGYNAYARSTSVISLADPGMTVYTLAVGPELANQIPETGAEYTLRFQTVGVTEIPADGVNQSVTGLKAGDWRYYRVVIPESGEFNGYGILGWEVRVTEWTGSVPPLVAVSRAEIPPHDPDLNQSPFLQPTVWRPREWIGTRTQNWTSRDFSADGSRKYEQVLISLPTGMPLEPATYYVGFRNDPESDPLDFRWTSRLITGEGSGAGYEVSSIDFSGGESTGQLKPREVAYFSVDVPEDVSSWKVKLETGEGDVAQLYIRKDFVPSIRGIPQTSEGNRNPSTSWVRMRTPGDQHFTYWPARDESVIEAGRYYFMVVSGGRNPATDDHIGTGEITFTLRSEGEVPVTDLGSLAPGQKILAPDGHYTSSEIRYYRFDVDPDVHRLELGLLDREGEPSIALARGDLAPVVGTGGFSGQREIARGDEIDVVVAPGADSYVLAVGHDPVSVPYGTGSYTLQISGYDALSLEFDYSGVTREGSLAADESVYYKVAIGETVLSPGADGDPQPEPVLGWRLRLEADGQATMRVRFDALPDSGSVWNPPYSVTPRTDHDHLLVVPPYLKPGDWYIEILGNTDSDYTLTSEPVVMSSLERAVWAMPAMDDATDAPGLGGAVFGDTGVAEDGSALPGDQGRSLDAGDSHLYAIEVPENNGGLLRTDLEMFEGEARLYVRPQYLPTADHHESGMSFGSTSLHELSAPHATEPGLWVPHHVLEKPRLQPGLWFLKVRAPVIQSARYRLTLSHHADPLVKPLAADGGSRVGQQLQEDDWRYYRVEFPSDFQAMPFEWTVTLEEISGTVEMYVRDSVPPGFWREPGVGVQHNPRDWATEGLNGPYARTFGPGTHSFDSRFMRPGKAYYLGVRATDDAEFSLHSETGGGTLADIYGTLATLEGAGGIIDTELAPHEVRTWKILFPEEARRWRSRAENSEGLEFYIGQNEFLPDLEAVPSLDRSNGAADWSRIRPFSPAGQRDFANAYFMTVVNTSAVPQPLWFFVDWRTEEEFALKLSTSGEGQILSAPEADDYTSGDTVVLTAVPVAGWRFIGWSGGIESTENPLVLVPYEELSITARFEEIDGAYVSAAELLTEHLFVGEGPGEPVEIAVDISNSGSTADSLAPGLVFTTGDFETWTARLSPVEVAAGETVSVVLEYDMEAINPGSSVEFDVAVDGIEAGSFVAFHLHAEARSEQGLKIGQPWSAVDVGEEILVEAFVDTLDVQSRFTMLKLEVDGREVDSRMIQVGGTSSDRRNALHWIPDEAGDQVVTVNGIEVSNSPVMVIQDAAPWIVEDIEGATMKYGHSTTLQAIVEGSGTLNYQWYHNDVPIPGANNTFYFIHNITMIRQGTYVLVVENDFGRVESSPAVIEVVMPPDLPPALGDASATQESGVYYSKWLGSFFAAEEARGWIHGEELGWIYVWEDQTPGSIWLWDPGAESAFYTGGGLYPYLFSKVFGWVYFQGVDFDAGIRWFHRYGDSDSVAFDLYSGPMHD